MGDSEDWSRATIADIIASLSIQELLHLGFPALLIDDTPPQCPVLGCSQSLDELLGEPAGTLTGHDATMVLDSAPQQEVDKQVRVALRSFFAPDPDGLGASIVFQAKHTLARASGELFPGYVYLKRVCLENRPMIVGLVLRVPKLVLHRQQEDPLLSVTSDKHRASTKSGKKVKKVEKAPKWTGSKPMEADASSDSSGTLRRQVSEERRRRNARRRRRDRRASHNMQEAALEEGQSDDDQAQPKAAPSMSASSNQNPPHDSQHSSWKDMELGEIRDSLRDSQAHQVLDENMQQVEGLLGRNFWLDSPLARPKRCISNEECSRYVPGAGLAGAVFGFTDQRKVVMRLLDERVEDSVGLHTTFDTGTLDKSSFEKQTSEMSQVSTACTATDQAQTDAEDEIVLGFPADLVKPWDPQQYVYLRMIHSAPRNQGCVCLMAEQNTENLVAAKVMPLSWVQESPEAFSAECPEETENPWMDICCYHYFGSVGFPYAPSLVGVYQDTTHMSIVSSFINGGDLFDWASNLTVAPGPMREQAVRPIVKQLAWAIKSLHERAIIHRDLSCENVLLHTTSEASGTVVKIIDFCAATTTRMSKGSYGKPSYQAPEMFEEEFDGFLSDAFAFGVILYCVCMMEYPWVDFQGRGDKCVQYVRMKGFRAFVERKKLCKGGRTVSDCMSEDLVALLEGLLHFDPKQRMMLGESGFASEEGRQSVWDSPWFQTDAPDAP